MSRRFDFVVILAFLSQVSVIYHESSADDAKSPDAAILIPPKGKYSEVRCVKPADPNGRVFVTEFFLLYASLKQTDRPATSLGLSERRIRELETDRQSGRWGTERELHGSPSNVGSIFDSMSGTEYKLHDVLMGMVAFKLALDEKFTTDVVSVTLRSVTNTGWQFEEPRNFAVFVDGERHDCQKLTRTASNLTQQRKLLERGKKDIVEVDMFIEEVSGSIPLAVAVDLAKSNRAVLEIGGKPFDLDRPRLGWTEEEALQLQPKPIEETKKATPKGAAPKKSEPAKSKSKPALNSGPQIPNSPSPPEPTIFVNLRTSLLDLLSELSEAKRTTSGRPIEVDPVLAKVFSDRTAAEKAAKETATNEANRVKREVDEKKAAASLVLAEKGIADKKTKLARTLLQGIIDRYPETEARKKAEELLKSLTD